MGDFEDIRTKHKAKRKNKKGKRASIRQIRDRDNYVQYCLGQHETTCRLEFVLPYLVLRLKTTLVNISRYIRVNEPNRTPQVRTEPRRRSITCYKPAFKLRSEVTVQYSSKTICNCTSWILVRLMFILTLEQIFPYGSNSGSKRHLTPKRQILRKSSNRIKQQRKNGVTSQIVKKVWAPKVKR